MNSMLEYKGYHATIEYDAEDEIFVGEVFGIKIGRASCRERVWSRV